MLGNDGYSVASDLDSLEDESYDVYGNPRTQLEDEEMGCQDPDLSIINDLIEHIEAGGPEELEARELLLVQYMACGWLEAARDEANKILKFQLGDKEATACVELVEKRLKERRSRKSRSHKTKAHPAPKPKNGKGRELPPAAFQELEQGYEVLVQNIRALHSQASLLHIIDSTKCSEMKYLELLVKGDLVPIIGEKKHFRSVNATATAMKSNITRETIQDIAIKDLEETINLLRESKHSEAGNTEKINDVIRKSLVRRVGALKVQLPENLHSLATNALMHVEHEILQRKYVTEETMYGDLVSEIPRENFFVSEDGYAWDMEELSTAIASNNGVMRNPLSKQMFTLSDIQNIIQHPIGKRLAAMQVKQSELRQGFRKRTVDELETLAKVLLQDMSDDQLASRQAVENFLSYTATLPEDEQKAIDELKVPAQDSHTKMAYDTTIGETVKDAQGNRICFHKTGDFLDQAVKYLRKTR